MNYWNHGEGSNISTVWSLSKSFPTKTVNHKCACRQVGETLQVYLTITVSSLNNLPSNLSFLIDLVLVSFFLFHNERSLCSLSWSRTLFCSAWLQTLDPCIPAIPTPGFQVSVTMPSGSDFLSCLRWQIIRFGAFLFHVVS